MTPRTRRRRPRRRDDAKGRARPRAPARTRAHHEGDPILGEPEVVVAEDVLAFAGVTPPMLRLYPIETHIAEKLHAYTMPRE